MIKGRNFEPETFKIKNVQELDEIKIKIKDAYAMVRLACLTMVSPIMVTILKRLLHLGNYGVHAYYVFNDYCFWFFEGH